MNRRHLLAVDLGLKLALVILLSLAVVFPHWHQFEGKAIGTRILTYPLAGLVVPAGWWLFFRRHPFPPGPDIAVILPFVIDTAGNALNLYDTVSWWDDANHLVNWAILTTAFLLAIAPLRLAWWNVFGMGAGFGAVAAIAWELLEYAAFIRNSPELATAYTDTLGDMALGLCGSLLASSVAAWRYSKAPSRSRSTNSSSERPTSSR